jgi:hypothetical protein
MPAIVALNTQRLEDLRRNPRQLGTGVYKDRPEQPFVPGVRGVLDLDVDAEASHFVGHSRSSWYAE